MQQVELRVDVSDVVGLSEDLSLGVTVCLPEHVPAQPLVCFAFPGGGYTRKYFTFDMPGDSGGGQAGWHTSRGWIVVTSDHLYCGDSSQPADPAAMTYEQIVDANQEVVRKVLELLGSGDLTADLSPIEDATVIAIGQSMGGALLVLHQGQHAPFDGVGILGWSAHHSVSWLPPEIPATRVRYFPRGTDMGALTPEVFVTAMPAMALDDRGFPLTTPGFHYDDVPADILAQDMTDYPRRGPRPPAWASQTIPPCSMTMMSPGAVAPEAASITVPVLVAVGERDVCPDPKSEPLAYRASSDISVYICPRMSHMHNFASTRHQMWSRIHIWGEGVAAIQRAADDRERTLLGV